MITGFNTDIQHDGTTYHVQTEDKGLDTPLVLSLVYVGGAILASKRTPYQDLIDTGFDEKVLIERLQRQHKLICAAISAGRIEDLKRMAERDVTRNAEQALKQIEHGSPPLTGQEIVGAPNVLSSSPSVSTLTASPQTTPAVESLSAPSFSASEASGSEDDSPPNDDAGQETDSSVEELYLHLLDDAGEFRAGELATIKIHVVRGADKQQSVADASVIIKILGTTFRPMVLVTKTDAKGLAVMRALLPHFSSGRAAIILRAEVGDDHAELRRIIHHA